MDFRKIPNISVDCVVFGLGAEGISILLSKRKLHMHNDKFPIIDDWVLAGDNVFKSERLDESAERIFQDLASLGGVYKKQFRTFGNPERIKNEKDLLWLKSKGVNSRFMSVSYYFLLPMTRVLHQRLDAQWFHLKELPQLGFDHLEIITRAYLDLQQKVMNEPVIFEFLNDKFTLNELQQAYEAVFDIEIDNRNFRRKAISKNYIVPLDEKQVGGVSRKPANLFMFSRDIYDKTSDKSHIINI